MYRTLAQWKGKSSVMGDVIAVAGEGVSRWGTLFRVEREERLRDYSLVDNFS